MYISYICLKKRRKFISYIKENVSFIHKAVNDRTLQPIKIYPKFDSVIHNITHTNIKDNKFQQFTKN